MVVPTGILIIRDLCFENFDSTMFASSDALMDVDTLMVEDGAQVLTESCSASVQLVSRLPSPRSGAAQLSRNEMAILQSSLSKLQQASCEASVENLRELQDASRSLLCVCESALSRVVCTSNDSIESGEATLRESNTAMTESLPVAPSFVVPMALPVRLASGPSTPAEHGAANTNKKRASIGRPCVT